MRPPIAIAIAIASANLKLHDPPNLSSGESSSRCRSAEGRRGAGARAGALSKYPRVGGRAGSTASVASRTGIELRDRALWRYGARSRIPLSRVESIRRLRYQPRRVAVAVAVAVAQKLEEA